MAAPDFFICAEASICIDWTLDLGWEQDAQACSALEHANDQVLTPFQPELTEYGGDACIWPSDQLPQDEASAAHHQIIMICVNN